MQNKRAPISTDSSLRAEQHTEELSPGIPELVTAPKTSADDNRVQTATETFLQTWQSTHTWEVTI